MSLNLISDAKVETGTEMVSFGFAESVVAVARNFFVNGILRQISQKKLKCHSTTVKAFKQNHGSGLHAKTASGKFSHRIYSCILRL